LAINWIKNVLHEILFHGSIALFNQKIALSLSDFRKLSYHLTLFRLATDEENTYFLPLFRKKVPLDKNTCSSENIQFDLYLIKQALFVF